MKKLIVLTAAVIIMTGNIFSGSFQLFSPIGGEQIESDNDYQIKWSDHEDVDSVNIQLWDVAEGEWVNIAENITNIGEYDWSVPTSYEDSFFMIKVEDATNARNYSSSRTFFKVIEEVGSSEKISTQTMPESNVVLYPNPAENSIKLAWSGSATAQIVISDILGNVLLQLEGIYSGSEIDVSNFATGRYSVKITVENQINFVNFIKI